MTIIIDAFVLGFIIFLAGFIIKVISDKGEDSGN